MLYFIPSWTTEIKEVTKDSLTNLADTFTDNYQEVELLILNFNSQLRYFLNENDLLDANYWNVWDAILEIKRPDGIPLSVYDLDLPADAEYIFGVNQVFVYVEEKLYANITFNTQGVIQTVIHAPSPNGNWRTDTYDDRGFKVLEVTQDVTGNIVDQKWLNEFGEVVLSYRGQQDQLIHVEKNIDNFNQETYETVDEIIAEMLQKYLLDHVAKGDVVISSANDAIKGIMTIIQDSVPVNYLLDGKDYQKDMIKTWEEELNGGQRFFVDNELIFNDFLTTYGEAISSKLRIGYPSSTALRLGNSNEEQMLSVYWQLDKHTSESSVEKTTNILANRVIDNEQIALVIEINNQSYLQVVMDVLEKTLNHALGDFNFKREAMTDLFLGRGNGEIEKALRSIITGIQKKVRSMFGDDIPDDFEIDYDKIVRVLTNIHIRLEPSYHEIYADLDEARLVVDLGMPQSTITQMNAISAGIPQINQNESALVVHKLNGWIVTDKTPLLQGLNYFLDSLLHWNQSLVANVKLIDKYDANKQINWWKGELTDG